MNNKILASVNGKAITEADVDAYIAGLGQRGQSYDNPQGRAMILEQLINKSLLVLDATTGQNAVSQAKEFKHAANITGLILTKLDGTAKGGIVFSIKKELDIPVKFIGVDEKYDDMQEFVAKDFVDALFETDKGESE